MSVYFVHACEISVKTAHKSSSNINPKKTPSVTLRSGIKTPTIATDQHNKRWKEGSEYSHLGDGGVMWVGGGSLSAFIASMGILTGEWVELLG